MCRLTDCEAADRLGAVTGHLAATLELARARACGARPPPDPTDPILPPVSRVSRIKPREPRNQILGIGGLLGEQLESGRLGGGSEF